MSFQNVDISACLIFSGANDQFLMGETIIIISRVSEYTDSSEG